ncbi:glycoside hydrolase family 32 protein [Aliiglaciecola sp. NS0011-25]|uniref:glycoside hydrolase family 32 protein n=1 Tax=Aliiglaciecola sp. NS0011-25 TaxID=3127654 RepID=UPI003109A17B
MQHQIQANISSPRKTWKPKYHFFKEGHWLNDPNGLFFADNKYHLFFQMNPDDTIWGNMHWGHAISEDFISWQHLPTAIHAEPDGLGYIFSGGAIVDHQNSSGFGDENHAPIVATFTQHSKSEEQVQSIAYSLDGGESFNMFEHNPVIPNPGIKDFRDPKVVWFEAEEVWIKSVVAGQCVHFYRSDNLLSWTKLSEFGEDYGAHGGVWECPDLFPLVCEESGKEIWVLLISINPGGPNGGSATQYFLGDFDGRNFKPFDKQIRWLDYGTDCYAGITWDNTPNIKHERILIAWMSNWLYANDTPDNSWRGAMTLPRKLSLLKTDEKFVLRCFPAVSFTSKLKNEVNISDLKKPISVPEAYSIHFTLGKNKDVSTLTWTNDLNEQFTLTLDLASNQILADRTKAGFIEKGFASVAAMPLELIEGENVKIDIFVDTCSVELFVNNGASCLTMLLFPSLDFNRLTVNGSVSNSNSNIDGLNLRIID